MGKKGGRRSAGPTGLVRGTVIVGVIGILLWWILRRSGRKEMMPGQQLAICTESTGCLGGQVLCGRVLKEDFVTADEAKTLIGMIDFALNLTGGGQGGPSIVDFESGAASAGTKFVDIYRVMEAKKVQVDEAGLAVYDRLKTRVKEVVAQEFGVASSEVYLTSPAFMSRITNAPAKTAHDEYWHDHVDKVQYGSFDYTVLVYLNDHGRDFQGGTFTFVNSDGTESYLVPKRGRINMFSSGHENVHRVDRVTDGVRYALTIAFTCNQARAAKPLKRS